MRLHLTVLLLTVATHQIHCKPVDSSITNYLDTTTNRDYGLEPRTGGSLRLNTEAKNNFWSGEDYGWGVSDELSAKELKELAQLLEDCLERKGTNLNLNFRTC